MCSYFNLALLDRNYFQLFEYLTSLFYSMTPSEEINSDKDDDIDIFTVQNPTATVSVLHLQQQFGMLRHSACFHRPQLKELLVRLNSPLPASLCANDYSVPQDRFCGSTCRLVGQAQVHDREGGAPL